MTRARIERTRTSAHMAACATSASLLAAGLLLVASDGARAQTPSPQVRLEVGWISREPRIAPPNRPDAPREEGWPEAGSRVQWVAHVFNRGTDTASEVAYSWRIDDQPVVSDRIDLPPGETTVWLPWAWTFDRHAISFALHPDPALDDATPDDDQLSVASDALSVGFWIEQSLYDWMTQDGRPGFERWAQGQLERWNQILQRAVYPTSPLGALDRLRLDQIIVEEDGVESRTKDLDADLQWWFYADPRDSRFLHAGILPRYLKDETIVFHELLHQRGLTDLYAYAVNHGGSTDSHVGIAEDGRLVAGSFVMPFLPLLPTVVYVLPDDGIMGSRYRFGADLTEHSAFGLNLRAARRTPRWLDQWGNVINGFASQFQQNCYLERRPEEVTVRLRDQSDRPLANAELSVFLDHSRDTYQDLYAADPDLTQATDAHGEAVLPGGQLVPPRPPQMYPKSATLILRVRTAAARGYAFVPVYDLNLLAFRGDDPAILDLQVAMYPWSSAIP